MKPTRHIPLPLLALTLVITGCGETATGPASSTTGPTRAAAVTTTSTSASTTSAAPEPEPEALPPHRLADLASLYDPLVEPLGYRVSRGALIVRDTYQVDPEGDHLALYLAPLDDVTPEQFALDLAPLVRVFLPEVFERWPELESFDLCQEPFDSEAETPPSLTLVDVTRAAAEQITWESIDLGGLIAGGESIDGLTVWARTSIRESEPWQTAATG